MAKKVIVIKVLSFLTVYVQTQLAEIKLSFEMEA